MAKRSQLKSTKTIESLTHNEAKRKNIPTAEYQSVLQKDEEKPKTIKYPRNTDLDPQLVWRGKMSRTGATSSSTRRRFTSRKKFIPRC